ncbi:MAG TPA: HAMP domain-containing sensor histidine kinase [Flavobacteriales bacterium]|nr:HAMP domain-containing sensor histidine kinase [Flavobacteriales bacterium]
MKASAAQADRLHGFSHDLRNRLIGLQQVLERFKDELGPEERDELLLYGEQQYFKALREVEKLMDDLGVARGIIRPEPQQVDLPALVAERAELLRFRYERKDQRLILDLNARAPISSDPRVLADLVDALLSNASKFSPTGSTIEVRLLSQADRCILEVEDHGVGLSAEDLARVFERFTWLDSRPTAGESQGRGTLARAAIWALALHGTLSATSPGVGQGCTFRLELPG